jgi:hypothetical protein
MTYRFRSTDFELDPALHPSCYQLNVACNLSDRRLLINDFCRSPGLPAIPLRAVGNQPVGLPTMTKWLLSRHRDDHFGRLRLRGASSYWRHPTEGGEP